MESTQVQYRLSSVKNKSNRTEKRTTTYTPSRKPRSKQSKSPAPQKPTKSFSKKPNSKLTEQPKHTSYDDKGYYYQSYKGASGNQNKGYYPCYQVCYVASPIVYPELFVPVYGYPICYINNPTYDRKIPGDSSPQEIGHSGCPTVASEEDLNKSTEEEWGFRVVCNGNVVHKECCSREQENDANAQSFISMSEYDEFVLPFKEFEPKSEAIPLPSFLA